MGLSISTNPSDSQKSKLQLNGGNDLSRHSLRRPCENTGAFKEWLSKQLIRYAASVIKTGNRTKKGFTERDMGIQGPLTFLQGMTTNTHFRYYAGKKNRCRLFLLFVQRNIRLRREIGSWYFNERVREICCLIAKWRRLFAIC